MGKIIEYFKSRKERKIEEKKAHEKMIKDYKAMVNSSKQLWTWSVELGMYWHAHGIAWADDKEEVFELVRKLYPECKNCSATLVNCSKDITQVCEYYT